MTVNHTRQQNDPATASWKRKAIFETDVQQTMSIRLCGAEDGIRAVLAAARGMPDVDGVIELGLDAPQLNDDSSSAGLPDDTSSQCQDVQLHVPNSVAYDYVHGRIETLAAHAGVVVEWLNRE